MPRVAFVWALLAASPPWVADCWVRQPSAYDVTRSSLQTSRLSRNGARRRRRPHTSFENGGLIRMMATTTTPPSSTTTTTTKPDAATRAQAVLAEFEASHQTAARRKPRRGTTTTAPDVVPLSVGSRIDAPSRQTLDESRLLSTNKPQVPAKGARRKPRMAVFLLNLGGPETSEDVEPFLYNLFADPDIIRLPPAIGGVQTALAWLIAKRRAPRSRQAYDAIGGGSPITRFTSAQARLLEDALNADDDADVEYRCYVAMRYWHPFTDEALDEASADGCVSAVILPLYPHFSISTTGSSLRALLAEMQAGHPRLAASHTVVPSWHASPGYVDVVASLVEQELRELPEETPADATAPPTVLFSAHGVPVSYIEDQGDPYKRHVEETVRLVSERVKERLQRRPLPADKGEVSFELSFQSRVGPVEWLRPYTDDALKAMAARGVRQTVVVPISFVSEHIETLEEIDIEYREIAEEAGIADWRRVPALNLEPAFIDELKTQVQTALYHKPVVSTSEACVVNAFDLDRDLLSGDVIPDVQQDVIGLNSKLAALALTLTLVVELLANTRAIHLFGLGAL